MQHVIQKRTVAGFAALAGILLGVCPASATETVTYGPQFCVTNASHSYNASTSTSQLTLSGNGLVMCPFVTLSQQIALSDADVWTSDGVTNTEVKLREFDRDNGDFEASYTPSTTVTGGVADHDWNTVTPVQGLNYLVITIDGAPNDKIFAYKLTDTGMTY